MKKTALTDAPHKSTAPENIKPSYENTKPGKIILASESPRRREILEKAGVEFEVMPSYIDETFPDGLKPSEAVIFVAQKKAEFVLKALSEASNSDNCLIIAADTIVVLEEKVIGKPADETDAFNILKSIQGRSHSVFTGVSLINTKQDGASENILSGKAESLRRKITQKSFAVKTGVTLKPMTDTDIAKYIKTGEPMDKAGAYAVQGRGCVFVERINGDFYNVMGLPVSRLYSEIKEMGIAI
ncbi:MAG: Maf family protein [Clostridiales bacterium]|jgi:septum formation protein|nr:Maf family protein [Clostridiales bacterium]